MPLIQDFIDYLAALPTEYILLFAILGLVLFTVGLLLGWLLQRRKTGRFRKRAERLEKEKEDLRLRLATADEEQQSLARELVQLTSEKDESLVQQRESRKNLDATVAEVRRLRANVEQLNATNQTYAGTIEDLNDQIIGLRTRNEQLLDGGAPAPTDRTDVERRLAALEAQIARLTGTDEPELHVGRPVHEVRIGPAFEEDEYDGDRDDLTRIHTIGPFNQERLNAAGVYRYAQIAAWSDEDLQDYAARIGYVADIMREEDWPRQAALAAEGDWEALARLQGREVTE